MKNISPSSCRVSQSTPMLYTHAVEANTYDSVPQQSSSGDDDGHYDITEGVAVVDDTALYSMCAGEDVQENGVYSKLNRK